MTKCVFLRPEGVRGMTGQPFVYESAQAASEACAREIIELLGGALASQPRVSTTVSGGNARKAMFAQMAKANFDCSNVHLFWVDERLVPTTDSQSNYKLPSANVHSVPHFDMVHRGMGADAHTASLFPGEPSIAGAVSVEKFQQWRITLLPAVLEAARQTLVLVAGEGKAEPLKAVLNERYDPKKYPAQIST
jgi:6-phosphogluconolactonase